MPRRSRKEKSQTKVRDLALVVVVDDLDQAKDHETVLRNNDIPAIVKEQTDEAGESVGYAVMVPDEFLDEAHVVIESQDAYDDFYDLAFEDEGEADFEDLLDDEY